MFPLSIHHRAKTNHDVSEEQVTNNCEAEEQDAEDENEVEQVCACRNHGVHEDAELKIKV